MKKAKEKKIFLEKLRETPITQFACRKANIPRSSVYRWKKEDAKFAKAVAEAMAEGEGLISDLSESQLVSLIKDRNFQAIHVWLRQHHPTYAEKQKIEGKITSEELPLTKKELALRRAALNLARYKPHDESK